MPLRILAERYARGEIGREEFQQIRRDLIEQEALAPVASDARAAATMDSLALLDTVTPNATLLAAASAFVAGSPGTQPSRILAGLIRALYLDGSVFHFDLLERLDPEQRAWAEGLIKAKLERLIPLEEWGRAYDIVRNFEHQNESTDTADHSTTDNDDWDSMLKEAEKFLSNGRSKAVPVPKSDEPGETTPAANPPGVRLAANTPAGPREATVVKLHETVRADHPVPFVPVSSPKRQMTLRHGLAGLVVVGIAVIVFSALRPKPAPPLVEARGSAVTAANTVIPTPAVKAANERQQSKGQILVPPADEALTQVAALPEKPIVQANGADKPAQAQILSGDQPAVATVTPDVTPPGASTATPAADLVIDTRMAPSKPVKTVVAAPASHKPARVKEVTPRQTIAMPAELPVPATDPPAKPPVADPPAKPPVQAAALAPALPPAPEIRPALRPDDIEAWSGGEDSLQQGLHNYQSGNFKDAAENLQKALEAGLRVKRNAVTAHKLLALSHCALGRESQCRQEFQQALRIDPSLTLGADEAAVPSADAVFGSARSAQQK